MVKTNRLAEMSKRAGKAWKAGLAETDRVAKISMWTERTKN